LQAGDGKPPAAVKTTATAPETGTADQEAFAEPYRTIQVATADMTLIREVLVREGDAVEARQPLVKLDDELLKASLEIAKQNLASRGVLNSAEAELRLHSSRAEKFETLVRGGNARPEEFEKAQMEKAVSTARVLSAQETLAVRKLELERTQLELERKTVRSPLKGVVTKLHREVGEFVSPADPVVVTVVQLDPLLATFSLKPAQVSQLHVGHPVQVQFASVESPVNAEVEFVAPVTDARSGTVRVKVRIPNPNGECRSGDRCLLLLTNRTRVPAEPPRSARRTP
jgi:RND family efflux transporter MFP subunit